MSLDLTGEPFPRDDRILCTACANLVLRTSRFAFAGECLAAVNGERHDVGPHYGPADVDLLRRCEFFVAMKGAEDPRSGRERYPVLFAEYEKVQAARNGFRRDAAARGLERAKAAIGAPGQIDGPYAG